jgi:RNA polymerase sigma-70 factor (ECF subfamily)
MAGELTEAESLLNCSGKEERRELLGILFVKCISRLRSAIHVRMDPRLSRRVSASDVIQETFLEATQRLDEYLRAPDMPFYLWLRFLALQRVKMLHRHHVGAQARDLRREVPAVGGPEPEAAGMDSLPARAASTPSQIFYRAEKQNILREAVDGMDPVDREVILLRHFEQLSWTEAARVLGMEETALRQRHCRALKKLKEVLRPAAKDWTGASQQGG